MNRILTIGYYTWKENIRNKIFYLLIFFAILVLFSTLLFAILGGEQELRLLFDFGLATIELFAFLTAIFASVTFVLEEIENRTIYLVLTRPLSRAEYLFARYLGILFSVYVSIAIMGAGHILLLMTKGWIFQGNYLLSLLGLIFKIMLISIVAIFFSLFSTSAISSISFTFFFWILGHFGEELRFLAQKVTNVVLRSSVRIFYYLIPNFQYFNFRDRFEISKLDVSFIILAIFYGLVYTAGCFVLANLFFYRKEF